MDFPWKYKDRIAARQKTVDTTPSNEAEFSTYSGVRITKKDGTRKTFYFDTLLIKDSTINGKKSHFIGLDIKPIKLDDISKIELQR